VLVVQPGDLPRVPAEVTIQVMRIVQEALTNVRKHARARRVWVRCEEDGGDLLVTVQDDGQGFDAGCPTGADGTPHYGLQIMRERAEGVGAALWIDSAPGKGTRIVLRLSIAREE
jgi:two-component system nitrate/nitrite sensor histidine kinase NarX